MCLTGWRIYVNEKSEILVVGSSSCGGRAGVSQ